MVFDPSRHSLTEVQAARRFYQATRQLGAFEEVLSHLLGDYDRATDLTMDVIWALDSTLAVASGLRDPAVAQRLHGRLGRQLTMAIGSLLRDYGMTVSSPVVVIRDVVGHVLVRGDHPDRAAIEALLNRSDLLTETIGVLLEAQQRLTTAEETRDLPSLTLLDQGQGVVIVAPHADVDSLATIGRS